MPVDDYIKKDDQFFSSKHTTDTAYSEYVILLWKYGVVPVHHTELSTLSIYRDCPVHRVDSVADVLKVLSIERSSILWCPVHTAVLDEGCILNEIPTRKVVDITNHPAARSVAFEDKGRWYVYDGTAPCMVNSDKLLSTLTSGKWDKKVLESYPLTAYFRDNPPARYTEGADKVFELTPQTPLRDIEYRIRHFSYLKWRANCYSAVTYAIQLAKRQRACK